MLKVNLLPSRPTAARRLYQEIKRAAPRIGRIVLDLLPVLCGMPVAMVVESEPPISRTSLLQKQLATLNEMDHLDRTLAPLKEVESQRLESTLSAFSEFVRQVKRMECTSDINLNHSSLDRIKRSENSFMIAFDKYLTFLANSGFPLKQKELVRAQVVSEVLEMVLKHFPDRESEHLDREATRKLVEFMGQKVSLQTLKVSQLEAELKEKESILNQSQQQMDLTFDRASRTFSQGLGDEGLLLARQAMVEKIGWYQAQIDLLRFRQEVLGPERQRLVTLEAGLCEISESYNPRENKLLQ